MRGKERFSIANFEIRQNENSARPNVALSLAQSSILNAAAQFLPGQYRFTDPNAINYPRRFYRVASP